MKKTAFQLYHKTSGHFPFKMLFGGASFWLFRAGFFPAFFSFLLQWIGWTDFPLFSSSGFEAETLNGPTFRAFFLQACFLQAARTLTGPISRAPFFKCRTTQPLAPLQRAYENCVRWFLSGPLLRVSVCVRCIVVRR